MGIGKNANTLYCIDFGLSKRYIDPKSGRHIQYKDKTIMAGTARYMSLNAHLEHEQSRKDDLEAVMLVLAYFCRKGMLPWMGLRAKRKDMSALQCKIKLETTPE
jgi:serine/threonine protein kinase